jgi:hypothetical protein
VSNAEEVMGEEAEAKPALAKSNGEESKEEEEVGKKWIFKKGKNILANIFRKGKTHFVEHFPKRENIFWRTFSGKNKTHFQEAEEAVMAKGIEEAYFNLEEGKEAAEEGTEANAEGEGANAVEEVGKYFPKRENTFWRTFWRTFSEKKTHFSEHFPKRENTFWRTFSGKQKYI